MDWDRDQERKAGKAMTIGSCVFGLVFSIFWCIMAASMGAGIMLIFGIPFVCLTAYRLYIMLKLSKKEDRKPTVIDAEPWEIPDRTSTGTGYTPPAGGSGYCPYCGGSIQESFEYCPKCGRKQP